MDRRSFLKRSGLTALGIAIQGCRTTERPVLERPRRQPNILFCMADDWGWPHAGAYGDPVVKTPAFDRLAAEGVLFEHAYVTSPSCTPSRSSILTGQYHWQLKDAASLWSTLDVNIPVFPLLLEGAGYHVGSWRKCWGPGDLKAGGYHNTHPCGKNYPDGFQQFLAERTPDQPFCFWLGSSDPHRSYQKGSGRDAGIPIDQVPVPGFYPDVEPIRSDIADYYFEVQRFDSDCAKAICLLEELGELDNTLIIMTGDNGIPFPRCKSQIYDMGVRVPLAVRWGSEIHPGRRLTDFMSLADLAPTFLEATHIPVPEEMTGRSLLPILLSKKEGRIDSTRDHVIFGKERHTPAQKSPSMGGYPCRGIRTDQYLYIRNFEPDRWPAGAPSGATHPMNQFTDCDDSPTKSYLIDHRDDPDIQRYYELSFAKRPAEELYDIQHDPYQLTNLIDDPAYRKIKTKLAAMLTAELKASSDPRVLGGGEMFDRYPYRAKYELNK
jgi:arylsulfatase A-like enzyme